MKTANPIRVLLHANQFNSAQILRGASKDGMELDIREAHSQDEFLRRLESKTTDVAVIASDAADKGRLREMLAVAASVSPEIPVVILGKDGEGSDDAIRYSKQGAADYLPASHLGLLPYVLRRVRRDVELIASNRELHAEMEEAQQALLENQKLMSIGRLAASIAHEINNPLESITNLLYLLQSEKGISPQAREYITLAEREMERVTQISKQTLNFYRETRNATRIAPSELLDEVLILYSRTIREKQIEVIRQYQTDVSLLLYPGEIRQVLSNLVTNALEATPAGGKLFLRMRPSRLWSGEDIPGIRIVVADTGSGISEQTKQRLGQAFYTTKEQRGTGLGLWVSRAIVKRYGGKIQMSSSTKEGQSGTVFSVFLPAHLRPRMVSIDNAERTSRLQTVARLGQAAGIQRDISGSEMVMEGESGRGARRFRKPPIAS